MRSNAALIRIFIVALALACASSAGAAESLTMDGAVAAALGANPELAAAGHELAAARARPPQAATPPDPQFMVDFMQVPIDTVDVGRGMVQYMVEQQVPFPSKLVYGYKAEKRAAEAAQSAQAGAALEIVRQVKRAYLEAWRAGEEARIGRETLSILRQSKGSATESYAALKGPIADPVRASVELGEIEGRLALLEQERIDKIAALGQLMARPLDPEVSLAPPPPLPAPKNLDVLIAESQASRPELGASQKMVESQSARLSVAKSQYAPDFTLRWGFVDMPAGEQNAWYGRAGITFPLWALSKQRFEVRESRAMLAKAESMKDSQALAAEAEVRSAHARFAAASKSLKVYEGTVIPRARLLLTSSQEAYRSGKGDFLGVVDGIRSLSNARTMALRARVDAAAAFADLDRAVGVPTEKEPR
jgi:outer membrane protein, heavy metal efflux system